jgi:hypothetical protein
LYRKTGSFSLTVGRRQVALFRRHWRKEGKATITLRFSPDCDRYFIGYRIGSREANLGWRRVPNNVYEGELEGWPHLTDFFEGYRVRWSK